MPIEPAMHGMMKLITGLGGVAVKGARVAGRVTAAAYSPMTVMNMLPKPDLGGPILTQHDREVARGLLSHGALHIAMGRNMKINTGGAPVYSYRRADKQSRRGQHTASSGRPKARKSMRGASAPRRRREEEVIYKRRK